MSKNFQSRLLTAFILVVVTLPVIYLPSVLFMLLVLVATVVALIELFDVGRTKLQLKKRHFIIPIIFICGLYVSSWFTSSFFLVGVVASFLGLSIFSVCDEDFHVPAFVYTMFSVLYAGLTYESLAFIHDRSPHYILFLFLAVFLTDTGAYFVGKRFGKHKLAVHLSPKKTIEGAIGGIVTGTFTSTLFVGLLQFVTQMVLDGKQWFIFIGISLLLSVASEFGDLFASKVKRFFEKKDFGFIFPGHGGVLDRVDGLILASMTFYIILHII